MASARTRYLLKLTVSCTIIAIILSRIDWAAFGETLSMADPALLGVAFVLLWVERAWAVYKWRFLLKAQQTHISLWTLFCIYNIGAFWGLFLPSSLSTDVVRGYYLSKNTADLDLSAASVVVDRMMGLFSLLFCCLVSVLFYSANFASSIIEYVVFVTVLCVVAACAAYWEAVPRFLEQRIGFFKHHAIGVKLISMHRAFLNFKQYPMVMVQSFLYSLVLQLIRVFTLYITALAFQIDAEVVKFFIVVPLTVIVIMIPVSIGGLGVREGSFISLFALVGVGVNDSFAISGTNSVMVTLIGLMGGIFYLSFKHGQQSAGEAAGDGGPGTTLVTSVSRDKETKSG